MIGANSSSFGGEMSRKDEGYDEVSKALDMYEDDVSMFDVRDERVEKEVDKLLDGINLEQSLKNFVRMFIGD
jgi:hypothetical protein